MNRIVALALLCAFTPRVRELGEARQRGRERPAQYAFFEFAPADGAGMPAVCSTTAPTGAKGETLTFTRATTATCTKTASGGLATTGIADGDLVSVASGVARVEYDSNGVLGLLVEAARTNSMLRSQEIDNAAWTKYSFGSGSAPTVTADYAVAPDGTMTADRVQFSAVNAGDQSGVLQASGITTGSNTVSLYVKGTSGSGSICLVAYISGGSYSTCNYVADSWTRCTHTGTVTSSGTMRFGNDSAACGGGAMTAQDVLVWGAQWEAGSYVTSYIPTTNAAVARNADTPPSVAFTQSVPSGSLALTTTTVANSHNSDQGWMVFCGGTVSSFNGLLGYSGGFASNVYVNGSSLSGTVAASSGLVRRSAYWGSSGYGVTNTPGSSTSGGTTTTMTGAPATLLIGSYACAGPTTRIGSGIYSRICVDPDPTRCR